MTFDLLPGGAMMTRGLNDIAAGFRTEEALLVMIGAPRLRRLGLEVVADEAADAEAELYQLLASSDPDSAHSRYNALIRLLVSFERALQSDVR